MFCCLALIKVSNGWSLIQLVVWSNLEKAKIEKILLLPQFFFLDLFCICCTIGSACCCSCLVRWKVQNIMVGGLVAWLVSGGGCYIADGWLSGGSSVV